MTMTKKWLQGYFMIINICLLSANHGEASPLEWDGEVQKHWRM